MHNKYNSLGGTLRDVSWSDQDLKPFNKNFYKEHADVQARTQ